MSVRTRFAPSPTGYLHIGGARTALFNLLYARRHKGKFVLRIEDTDVARSTKESIQAILDGMEWLGLNWDEGPFFQSKRFDEYRKRAEDLLAKGHLYRCYCTPEELESRREAAMKAGRPPMYDGRCRERTDQPDLPFALRFRVPPGVTSFKDEIKGVISFENSTIEDLVVLRSDSTPTYNFCVVVDDAEMAMTHVIRGDDHINNTPKQILLYRALGYEVPVFAHLPMILGSDKTRLSKRHGATSVMAYKEMGYLPHALVNYLARLGWSHGDQEIFSLEELVDKFSLESVGKSSGVFNPEKLLWLNQHYIKSSPPEELAPLMLPFWKELGVDASGDTRLPAIIKTLQERARTLKEMAEGSLFYFRGVVDYDPKAREKFLTPESAELFDDLLKRLSALPSFTEKELEAAFNSLLETRGLKLGKLAQPVRVALTGGTVSPGIFETLSAMGRDLAIKRLKDAAAVARSPHDAQGN
ncbi:MAG: glutamate--tRNA ligase [Deltaproteobacteria bacterium]|nr:glutamate--tRNA ligase [Deltaproteobacteria bacterium]MBZ0220598.1 glutamate--tRNA ligase [Deltaproteobacteria bacterium]